MTGSSSPTADALASLRQTLRFRLRAAAIHFSLSLGVFAVALYLILVRWYPGFHFYVDGGWQGVRIMAAVDLVLGPMLTLIVFNPLKARRLIAFDLSCIGATQLAALAWGFYAIHGQQPVSINFHEDIFFSMPARSLRPQPEAEAVLRQLSDRRPALVFVAPAITPEERQRRATHRQRGLLEHEDAFFFRPFEPHWAEIQRFAIDAGHSKDPLLLRDLPGFLQRHGGQAADYRFFRYQAGYGSCYLALTPQGEPIDALGCLGN